MEYVLSLPLNAIFCLDKTLVVKIEPRKRSRDAVVQKELKKTLAV